jgi:hypothetical protein
MRAPRHIPPTIHALFEALLALEALYRLLAIRPARRIRLNVGFAILSARRRLVVVLVIVVFPRFGHRGKFFPSSSLDKTFVFEVPIDLPVQLARRELEWLAGGVEDEDRDFGAAQDG